MHPFHTHCQTALTAIEAQGRYRRFTPLRKQAERFPLYRRAEGSEVLVWSSNDYLGMGGHPVVIEAACDAARQRFVREAQALASVRDDHVIAVHAVSDDGPLPYLVMEYIAGATLEDRIRRGEAMATEPLESRHSSLITHHPSLPRRALVAVVVGWFAILILAPAVALVRGALAGGMGPLSVATRQ